MKPESAISLYKLNKLVKGALESNLSNHYWIKAETSDVRINQNGHCYLEFIEKDVSGKNTIAKARAMIWSNTFHLLKAFFEETTNQPFTSGIKVLVMVSVSFHELYGYSLTVNDIDPRYTLGDQAMHRATIIKQLTEEGVLEMNKELLLPTPANRIAVISSPTAAGYEDFCHQLSNNPSGYTFYLKLFPAIMQGDKVEESIINALEKIYEYQDLFDAVAIIRGGGATSDLTSFDSYLLAANCAQFPIPIVTGIGHERDETVLDIVAHTKAKTPTAVAEFFISQIKEAEMEILTYQSTIIDTVEMKIQEEFLLLNSFELQNSYLIKNRVKEQLFLLDNTNRSLKLLVERTKKNQLSRLDQAKEELYINTRRVLSSGKEKIENLDKQIDLISPQNLLQKGYTFTTKNGKIVKSATILKKGDQLSTVFSDGTITSTVD